MSGKMQKNTASFIATIVIGLVVVSFMFSGYQTLRGTPDTIAKVADQKITVDEFRNEFGRLLKFYSQLTGGKDLTSKQIEQFKVRDAALRNLVQQKLALKLVEKFGIKPASKEVASEIKELPYFQTNKKFDLAKYKGLLAANRMNPKGFEETIHKDISLKKMNQLLRQYPISEGFNNEIQKIRNSGMNLKVVQINKNDLLSQIKVSKNETKEYLANKDNMEKIKNIFKTKESGYSKPERIKARHILLRTGKEDDAVVEKKINDLHKKITKSNFIKVADLHTEDPSGKGKGGDLGTFEKGRMVPEFEKVAFETPAGKISKPVKTQFGYHIILVEKKMKAVKAKLADYQEELAIEQIRKKRSNETAEISKSVIEEVKKAWNSKKKLERLVKKYDLKFENAVSANLYDGLAANSSITLPQEDLGKLFAKSNEMMELKSALVTTIAESTPTKEEKKDEDANSFEQEYARKLNQEVMAKMGETYKAKVFQEI